MSIASIFCLIWRMKTGTGMVPRARFSVKSLSNVSVTDMIESMIKSATRYPPFLM